MTSFVILVVLIISAIIIYLWGGNTYDFTAIHPASIGGAKIIASFNPAVWHPAVWHPAAL